MRWPWGNQWDRSKANTAERLAGVNAEEDYSDTTVKVKSYGPNGYGLYDMAGNAWEWCQDWYKADAYRELRDGVKDPSGPGEGDVKDRQPCRVVRGGGWGSRASYARCADRDGLRPSSGVTASGLRVAVAPRP